MKASGSHKHVCLVVFHRNHKEGNGFSFKAKKEVHNNLFFFFFLILGFKPRVLSILGKHSTTELPFLLFSFKTRSHDIAQGGLELTM
jgi:hypothetical protein